MSAIRDLRRAAELATGTGWIRIAFKVAPYVAIAGLAIALICTRATLDHVRMQAKVDAADLARAGAEQVAAEAARMADAADAYAMKAANLKPIVIKSKDAVDAYAQTDAGRVPCRGADRVRGIDELDQTLFPSSAAGGGDGAVPADTTAPTG